LTWRAKGFLRKGARDRWEWYRVAIDDELLKWNNVLSLNWKCTRVNIKWCNTGTVVFLMRLLLLAVVLLALLLLLLIIHRLHLLLELSDLLLLLQVPQQQLDLVEDSCGRCQVTVALLILLLCELCLRCRHFFLPEFIKRMRKAAFVAKGAVARLPEPANLCLVKGVRGTQLLLAVRKNAVFSIIAAPSLGEDPAQRGT
jgi:hypothetical protein